MARDHADLVLIDSPPVLAVSDNLALASQVDGILLVVRSGVTRRRNLVRAKAQLEKVRAHVVGVIVNGLSPRDTRRYYAAYTQYVMTDDAVAEPTRARLSRIMTRAVSTLTKTAARRRPPLSGSPGSKTGTEPNATPDAGRTTR
jgi:Mrp family chromosome partitioning ATPase